MSKYTTAITYALLSVLFAGGTASAYTINDTTWSLDGHTRSNLNVGWMDVVGDPSVFQVFGVDVTRAGGQITYDIYTNLSNDTIAFGDYNYYMADFGIDADRNGSFEFGVVLKDHNLWTNLGGDGVNAAGGPGTQDVGLYSGVTWNNSTYFNEQAPGPGGVGYGEKYAVGAMILDPVVGFEGGTLVNGAISLTQSAGGGDGNNGPLYKYSFILGETELGLTPTSLDPVIFWGGATCANDAITNAPVPEPASLLLLATGLVGLVVNKKRAKDTTQLGGKGM